MILVTQNEDIYEIRFPYDPVAIQLVKNVPGRMWNPEQKYWYIPKARLGFLIAQFKGTKYESQLQIQSNEDINVNATINEQNPIPDIDISDVNLYVQEGGYVFQHQKDMLKFAKWRMQNGLESGFILADQMGCGKSLEVMLWAMYLKEKHNAKHCLIIACVNSAKYNWREDIIKHTNGKETPLILGTRLKRDGTLNLSTGSKEKLEDLMTMKMYGGKTNEDLPYFIILNIEAIRMRTGKQYPIADRLIEMIDNGDISIVALDEIHRNCLEYDTLVETDEGEIKIGDIVRNKLKVKVLSYDVEREVYTYEPVVDWHEVCNESNMIELVVEEGSSTKVIRCTTDHEFYTRNRGWVPAYDLDEVDDIVLNKEVLN